MYDVATAHTPCTVTNRRRLPLMRRMYPSDPLNTPSVTRTWSPFLKRLSSGPKYSSPLSPEEHTSMNMFISFSGMACGFFPISLPLVYTNALLYNNVLIRPANAGVERKNSNEFIIGLRSCPFPCVSQGM